MQNLRKTDPNMSISCFHGAPDQYLRRKSAGIGANRGKPLQAGNDCTKFSGNLGDLHWQGLVTIAEPWKGEAREGRRRVFRERVAVR
jgi:hypothetical protein